jgi:hypothetical protein
VTKFLVESTPTFFVNDKRMKGDPDRVDGRVASFMSWDNTHLKITHLASGQRL